MATFKELTILRLRSSKSSLAHISVSHKTSLSFDLPISIFFVADLPRALLSSPFSSASDPEQYDITHLPSSALDALEADTFWCLSKLLDGIQDNFIFAQPGIQRQVRRMGELVARIDGE